MDASASTSPASGSGRGAAPTSDGLSTDAVAHVAKLARLALSREQLELYRTQLTGVLGHVAKLQAIDVGGIEPMAHPFSGSNRLADDEPGACMELQDVLRNAPAVEGRFLAVPKVLADND